MFKKIDIAFREKDKKDAKKIRKHDEKIGILHKEIIFYLVKISQMELGKEETKKSLNYIFIQNELESIGDIIDKNLVDMAKKMRKQDLSFSEYGQKELTELHGKVMENIERMVTAFREEDFMLAKEIVENYSYVDEKKYQLSHIKRLNKWIKPSVDVLTIQKPSVSSSSFHLDAINYYARINDHVVAIANKLISFEKDNSKKHAIKDHDEAFTETLKRG